MQKINPANIGLGLLIFLLGAGVGVVALSVPSLDKIAPIATQEDTTSALVQDATVATCLYDLNTYTANCTGEIYRMYELDTLFANDRYTFQCKIGVPGKDSTFCDLLAYDSTNKTYVDLDFHVESEVNIKASPDKKHVLLVNAHSAYVLDTVTLEKKLLYTAHDNMELGYSSSLPSFVASGRWLSSNDLEISEYPSGTGVEFHTSPEGYSEETPPEASSTAKFTI
ncbi:MAG: hypothetical protein ABIT47_03610 [Candidatus Paceibacterota bacterium]